MNLYRRTAMITGVLFILATVLALISTALTKPLTDDPNYLVSLSAHENQVVAGFLFELAAALSIALIPAMLFPVLKRFNEGIAAGYLSLRIIEAITLIIDGFSLLLLVTLSQEYIKAGTPVASYFQTSGALLLGVHNWEFPLNPVVFGLGALLFYSLLFQSKLIPRWLSAWGLIGAILVFLMGLLGLFGLFAPLSTVSVLMAIPIAVQEMALAIWLIAKGFNATALAGKLEN